MKKHGLLTRRNFLAASLLAGIAAAALFVVPRWFGAGRLGPGKKNAFIKGLASRVKDHDGAVGSEYLGMHPEENDAMALAGLILAGDFNSEEEAIEAFLGRIKTDFSEDNTIVIRGWMLSRTEARLYALAGII